MKKNLARIAIVSLAALTLAGCGSISFTPMGVDPTDDPTAAPSFAPTPGSTPDAKGDNKGKGGKGAKIAKAREEFTEIPDNFPAGIPIPTGTLSSVVYNSIQKTWTMDVRMASADLRTNYAATRAKFESAGFQALDPATSKWVALSAVPLTDDEYIIKLRGKGYDITLKGLDYGNTGANITIDLQPTA